MKKNLSDYFVALSVIACSAVLLGALAVALSGWGADKGGRTWEVDFADVTGIRLHSQVRYAGAPAGSVVNIRLLTQEERNAAADPRNAVRVKLKLDDGVPVLRAGTNVTLGADSMLGEKFIALQPAGPEAEPLPPGTILAGKGATSLDALFEKVGPLVETVDSTLKTAERTLQGFDPLLKKTGEAVDTFKDGVGDALPRISALADSLKETSESADSALKRIDGVVNSVEEPLKANLEELQAALTQVKTTLDTADRLLSNTDKQLGPRMGELAVILQNLKVATTHAKAAFQTLGEHPHRLLFGGKPLPLPTEEEILRSTKPVPVRRATLPNRR